MIKDISSLSSGQTSKQSPKSSILKIKCFDRSATANLAKEANAPHQRTIKQKRPRGPRPPLPFRRIAVTCHQVVGNSGAHSWNHLSQTFPGHNGATTKLPFSQRPFPENVQKRVAVVVVAGNSEPNYHRDSALAFTRVGTRRNLNYLLNLKSNLENLPCLTKACGFTTTVF